MPPSNKFLNKSSKKEEEEEVDFLWVEVWKRVQIHTGPACTLPETPEAPPWRAPRGLHEHSLEILHQEAEI